VTSVAAGPGDGRPSTASPWSSTGSARRSWWPPLVFDDPFVTLDDTRAMRALELLREIARDFQVIYLTTSDRYHAAADAVVALEGPTEVDDAAEPVVAGTAHG